MTGSKIDFVIPWVDGNDPEWRKEKSEYQLAGEESGDAARYRDWDNLQYWFRAVERYAPWVNKIYFITWGHLPAWLNTDHPKLAIVNHKDYIPAEYLPTFSTHPIELNMHRISGLSEQFVYFNDDVFLTRPVKPEDFFVDGYPKDCCIESAVMQDDYADPFAHILINSCSLINMHFDKRSVIKKQWKKWFAPVYGVSMLRNLLMYPYHQFSSFKFFHIPGAFLKESFREVWKLEPEILDLTCRNRFRGISDVNQYVFKYYQFVTGNFAPQSPKTGRFFILGRDDDREIQEAVRKQKYKMICMNDSSEVKDFERMKSWIADCFEEILPEKSGFERG